ncbi:TetR/AcrR family transcriptional regulator [Nocardioides sp.]|uniref:TetR/AcrR family transcriptional regulator n=1 Tax=Nocardioides sp. TaxID=35761 RepID=UPI0035133CBA
MTTTGRTYGGESAADRAARRRTQLLDAGLEVFGTDGYRKATVRQLCREAKVADRYFYEEFPGTEDLLLAVYDRCLDRLQAAVVTATSQAAHEELATLAEAGLTAFFSTLATDPRTARVVWFEILGVSARVEAHYLRRTEEFGALLAGVVDDRGVLDSVPADQRRILLQALVGGISQVVLHWAYDGATTPPDQLVPPLVRFLLAGAAATTGPAVTGATDLPH